LKMENIRNIYWRLLQSRVSDIACQLTTVRVPSFRASESWCPAINAYRCRDGIVLCVDLAGVDKSDIQVSVESRRVLIRGQRQPLEPSDAAGSPLQVLALEIDYGPFEREVVLPLDVDPERVEAEQRSGLLWIVLPLPLHG
jgi:HSP20 family protein